MPRLPHLLGLAALPAALVFSAAGWTHPHLVPRAARSAAAPLDSSLLATFKWRNIGPERGGRSIAVSGVRGQPNVAYFGAVGGGLWKSTDTGQKWAPVTDGQITSASVGAVGVSETDPNEVVIGTGECEIRGNIMPGDGMYRSTDAGKSWTHVGFGDADAICKVRVDPTDANTVFAAVFGKYAVPSADRGVFKSTDGGVTWKKVLFRNDSTGAIDIEIDRNNPKIVYAALWQAYRKEYTAWSGGAGCGLFKSTDGGETWTEITRNPGLPSGIDGKIGIAVSPANSNRVYALVENANGGLFRSDDAGATWTLVNDSHDIRQRAFYYTHVYADPKDENLIYMQNTSLFKSTDGGKTLTTLRGTHGDFHDLWIDPDNGEHMVVGNDGGGAVTTDGGKNWTAQDYSTAQMYHVAATVGYPYDVCGAQQDDGTTCIPSTTGLSQGGFGRGGRGGGRGGAAAETYSAGGAEPGYIAPDPLDPDVFFSGSNNGGFLERLNRRTGESREVNPYPLMFSGEPSSALVERWQWTYPIVFSPLNPHLLYVSSQHLWKTTNGGQTWTRISPDLTRHDPSTMGPSGGPITHDMNAPEVYATIFAVGPSKKDVNVIWTGSDDGLINVTRDGGKTWTNVTPKGMPDFGRVSQIDASAFDGGAAYVAVKRPLLDDKAPYIFRTHDYGKTWTKIVTGIRADDYVHAVREDPSRRGMLFAATQHGVYLSYDDGDHWSSLSLNLPDVPVSDLIVWRHDLVISTHGRGFYILDNIEPLEQDTPAVEAASDAWLYAPPAAVRSTSGATITYWLKHPAGQVTLEVLDAKGQVIRTYKPDTAKADSGRARGGFRRFGPTAPPKVEGVNHFTWDLRYEPATGFDGMILWGGGTQGPAAPPGRYAVRLLVDGHTLSQPLVVTRNPLFTDVTNADLQAQFALGIRIRDKLSEANRAVIDVRNVKSQVDDRLKKSDDATLKTLGARLDDHAGAIEQNIYQVKNQSGQDPLNFPIKINNRIATLLSTVNQGDGRPIGNAEPIFDYLSGKLKVQTDALAKVWATDLAAFNAQAKKLGLPPINPKCAQGQVCGIVP